jgi:two-component system sensor histidine kinase/response regulator
VTSPVGAPQPSRQPRTPSFSARLEPGATPSGPAGAIEVEVRRALFQRLLGESARAEIAHLLVCTVVGVLLWPSVGHLELSVWGAAIGACTLTREVLRRRLIRPTASAETGVQRIRLVLAATGLTWGVGAAAFMPSLPLSKTALLLVVLCGLAAGGVASVAADRWSFRYFLAGLLVPVPVGLLQTSFERDTAVAILLVILFAAAMIVFHRNSHDLLFGHLMQSAELSQRERKAVQDRAYLDALLASAPIAIAVVDRDGRIRGTNPQFTALFGYDGAEAVGRDLNELVVPRSELGKASRFDQRARRGETVAVEAERRRKDGTLVAVRASAREVKGSGDGDVLVMYENIGDRRRAEDALTQLASIVQSSEDAIIGQTLDGTIATWNAAAQRLFGYAPGEVQGRPIAQLTPPDRADELTMIFDRIRRGEHVDHFETVRLRKDGTPIPVSLSVSLTRDATGRIRGFSIIARDVREQIATREALREARDVAQRLATTRSAFLANMSHEIRTPMNAILGLTELLLDTELAPEQRHSLALVQTSAETLLTLLNDILDFSKIEAEHLQLEHIAFDLPHLLESTMSMLAVRARERRLELVADVATDVPSIVRGDPTRLRQILTNLISNAIKFTHQGEVVVSATRTDAADGRATIRLAVRDTGIGIPTDKLGTIFEEFSQADASMTRKYGGTGLGLAIARRLVRLMGGDLAVASEVDQGTEFSFTVAFATDSTPVAAGPSERVSLAGRRALVVDDNATNRRIVVEILAAAGMPVAEAVDGAAALETLRRARREGAPHELAVIDAQMPGLDGFQLAAAVRDDAAIADTRLVMLTSAGQRGDGQRCRDLGIRGYLPKPTSRSDLLETIGTVLAAPAPTQEETFITRHSIAESRRRLQVLVAEDNPVNQEVAATMLRKRGHDIDVANNGREAVAAAGRKRYDVILMDVQMPEMDGFEATHAIRATEAGRTLPIIALTAHALSGERERCLAQGMSGYLTKPFKAHELFAAVEGWAATMTTNERTPAVTASLPVPVDLDAFRHEMRAAGAEEAVDPVLDTFLQSAPDRVAALTTALAAGAAPDIERAAHAFKSASATIGAKVLAALLQQLEIAGKAGDVAGARRVGDGLVRESEAVIAYLRQVRAAAAPAP